MLTLVQWVSIFTEMTSGKDVRAALKAVNITVFDADKWSNMVATIDQHIAEKVASTST